VYLYNGALYLSSKKQQDVERINPYVQVGKNIREIREVKLKIKSQAGFGRRVKTTKQPKGFTGQAVSLWETGLRLPDTEALIKIADLGNTTTDWVLARRLKNGDDCPRCRALADAASPPIVKSVLSKLVDALRDYVVVSKTL